MNSSRLNAAQLLMNYSAHENGKICQKVCDSEFSQELLSMTDSPQSGPAVEAVGDSSAPPLSNGFSTEAQSPTAAQPRDGRSGRGLKAIKSRFPRSVTERSPSNLRRSFQSGRTDDLRQMVFSNPLLVEKILAQLQFPAEARQACKEAMSKEGNLPVDSLIAILGQKQNGGKMESASPAVSAMDVQELMSSIKAGATAVTTDRIKLKQAGFYNAQELRELMLPLSKNAGREVSRETPSMAQPLMSPGAGSGSHTVESDSEQRPDVGSWKTPEGHVELLSSSRLPSFSAIQPRRSEEMRRHPSDDMQRSQQQRPASDVGQTTFEGTMESVRVLSITSPVGEEQQLFRDTTRQDAGPGALMAGTGGIPSRTVWENTSAYSDPAEPAGWGPHKTRHDAEEVPLPPDHKITDAHEPPNAVGRPQFEAGRPQEPSVNGPDEVEADMPSPYDIESLASSDEPFTSSGQPGSESPPSDSQEGGQDAREFRPIQDGPSRAKPMEADSPFSLAQPTHNIPSAAHGDEGTARVNVYQPGWTQKITEHLQESIREGKSSLVVELEPEDLGQLTLRIEADQRHVTAWITTQSEQARNLLLQNTSTLQKHLADHGLNLGQFSVNVGGERGNPGAAGGGRGERKVSRATVKTGSSLSGLPVVPGIHSRLMEGAPRQRISLMA